MKSSKLILFSLCLFAATFLLTSCGINGKGDIVKKTYTTEPFTGICNNIGATVHITKAPAPSVEILAQQNILSNISLTVSNNILNIEFTKKNVFHFKEITVNIAMPSLSSLKINGSGNMNTTNTFDSCGNVAITINGSGKIAAAFSSNALTEETINGSGNIDLSGHSASQKITVNGSGSIHSFPFSTNYSTVHILGSGSCELSTDSTLDVKISGSGKVTYKGNPIINQTINGSGSIQYSH